MESNKKSEDQSKDKSNNESEIPGMDLNKYSSKKPPIPQDTEKDKKEMEKTKKEIEKLKSLIVKKYPFIQAISILPPNLLNNFVEEEIGEKEKEIPKEEFEKLLKKIHLMIIIPEENLEQTPTIKKEIVKKIEEQKQNAWVHIKTPSQIWEMGFDSKFELISAIAMSFPLHDKGILTSLRVAEIHKSLVLQKFEKYVVSYIIAGSLVRGDVTKESDVDVFVVINDTDVKRMPRLELKERLRGIIYQYISEALAIAGVKKNILNVQVYLLTDFWESVKDAHPVIFTFIRDGVPLYDRGTFMPWKALLKMGKLKPSPEAIDMFMSMGDKTVERAKKTLLDIVVYDVYWSVITPAQALLMLYGLPPPTPKHIVKEMNRIFVTKEKMLEKKYINILEKVIKKYKDFEHERIKEIKGKEIDTLLAEIKDYLKRLKELRNQIEKNTQEKTIEQIYEDVFKLLKPLTTSKSKESIIKEFEEKYVKKGKFTPQHLRILKNIVSARQEFKKGKLSKHKIDEARRNASVLINEIIEYSQRKDLVSLEKGKMILRYKDKEKQKTAELLNTKGQSFLFVDNKIKKITDKIQDSNMQEVSKVMQEKQKDIEIQPKVFELLKKELGDFEIIL